ncbi:hypothetical protein Moror_2846 [Moniliophthora roreri MCA 2997]|uniref:Uncharacterized protein n=1 Tax=Moniliophthora roreri (strain MCA 2997) TaxID=1381753 RepID=V2XC40_MONRO|nr:hypothetical protein Moror_2846 [Moniliophthora roreri MCA 2997]
MGKRWSEHGKVIVQAISLSIANLLHHLRVGLLRTKTPKFQIVTQRQIYLASRIDLLGVFTLSFGIRLRVSSRCRSTERTIRSEAQAPVLVVSCIPILNPSMPITSTLFTLFALADAILVSKIQPGASNMSWGRKGYVDFCISRHRAVEVEHYLWCCIGISEDGTLVQIGVLCYLQIGL